MFPDCRSVCAAAPYTACLSEEFPATATTTKGPVDTCHHPGEQPWTAQMQHASDGRYIMEMEHKSDGAGTRVSESRQL